MLSINNKGRSLLICVFLALVITIVYWQVREFEFLDWDDTIYLTENVVVQSGITFNSIKWAFSSFYATNWHPVTWLSHMLDVQLFGMDAGWHHLISVLFHTLSTLLLFLILTRITGLAWRSFFVAMLFALHPLHVESVAWVAERKDVLSAFFWMLAIYSYTFYIQHPGLKRYLWVIIFFAIGLMAKPMLVTLPFVLLLLDYWPLKRFSIKYPADGNTVVLGEKTAIRHLVLEKAPLLMLSIASAVVTFMAQEKGGAVTGASEPVAHASVDAAALNYGLLARLSNALTSYTSYLSKTFYPHDLSFFYPFRTDVQDLILIQSALLVLGLSFVAVWQARRRPYLFVGWFWFVGMLVPVSGVVLVGWQSMADRYTYLPLVGVFIVITWGVSEFTKQWAGRNKLLALTMVSLTVLCAVLSYVQVGYWRNNISLYQQAVKAVPDSAFVHFKLGTALAEQGEYKLAKVQFEETLRIESFDLRARFNLGLVLLRLQQFDKAIKQFDEVLKRYPSYTAAVRQIEIARAMLRQQTVVNNLPAVYMRRGMLLEQQGRIQDAVLLYQKILQYQPEHIQAHQKLAFLRYQLHQVDEAIVHYKVLVQLQPDSFIVHYNLGLALVDKGQFNEAVEHYQQALRIQPDLAQIYNSLGVALLQSGKVEEAIKHFQTALQKKPDYLQAKNNLNRAVNTQSNVVNHQLAD